MVRALVLLVLLTSSPCVVAAETISGRVVVTDGDTIRIGDEKLRLFGIDAPEIEQSCERRSGGTWACGRWSRDQLRSLVERRTIVCEGRSRDRYGRLLVKCAVDGVDIGGELVRMGAAEAYRKYSTDYVDEEKEAVFAGAGIWQGRLQAPEDYRAAERAANGAAGATAASADGCVIKGNVSGSGRIYHLPGQEDYEATRINPSRGERWFCSEADARAAGWRRALR